MGRLANLSSLTLRCPDKRPALLAPLRQLASLTALTFEGAADPASGAWLPGGLRRLSIGAGGPRGLPAVGHAWLKAVLACTGLESLRLNVMRGRDLRLNTGPLGVPPFAEDAFYEAIGKVRGWQGFGWGKVLLDWARGRSRALARLWAPDAHRMQ
jgi:hypothetical protein